MHLSLVFSRDSPGDFFQDETKGYCKLNLTGCVFMHLLHTCYVLLSLAPLHQTNPARVSPSTNKYNAPTPLGKLVVQRRLIPAQTPGIPVGQPPRKPIIAMINSTLLGHLVIWRELQAREMAMNCWPVEHPKGYLIRRRIGTEMIEIKKFYQTGICSHAKWNNLEALLGVV